MKKLSAIVIFFISIILLSLISCLLLMDYSSIYQKFLKEMNLEISPQILTQVKIHKFPVPYLQIAKLTQEDKMTIENLEIRFSLASLITFTPKISYIKASNMTLYLTQERDIEFNLIKHPEVIANIIKQGFGNIDINIDNLAIINDQATTLLTIKNFTIKNSKEFVGEYNNSKFTGNLKLYEGEGNFEISINSSALQLIESYKNFTLDRGRAKLQISDFQYFLNYFIPNVSNIFSEVNSREIINIDLDIINQKDSLNIKNIKINSASGETQGEGEIKLNNNEELAQESEINFDFKKINLVTEGANSLPEELYYNPSKFMLYNKLAKITMSVDELLFNNQTISKVALIASFNKNILNIKSLSGNLRHEGNFLITGELTNNNYRNIFEGQLNLKHHDFNDIVSMLGYKDNTTSSAPVPFTLDCALKFSSIDLYLKDIILKTPENVMEGQFAVKFIGAMPRITSIVEVSSINFDKTKYPVLTPTIDFIYNLSQNMQDENYLNKYIPIRTIGYLGNFDFTFNNVVLHGKNFNKIHLLTNISPGLILVDNLSFTTKNNDYLNSKIELSAQGVKPALKIIISDGFMPINFLRASFLEELRTTLLSNYSLDKIALSLEGNLSTLYQNELEIKNIVFQMQNDNNLFNISNLEAELSGGKLTTRGSMLLDPYSFNFVYAFNSVNLEQFSQVISKSLLTNTQGSFSINGMFSSSGDTLEKLLYNFYFKSHLIAKGIKMSNFSIDDFIIKINTQGYNPANLKNDMKIALLTGDTVFDQLEGDIEVNKGYVVLKDMILKTAYSSGVFASTIHIYDFALNFSSLFNFYYSKPNAQRIAIKLPIKAGGSFFQPNKAADTEELEAAFKPVKPLSTLTK